MRAFRRLIVSADDFGLSPAVNAGVIAAHRDGILTDASLMVNGAAFDDAVALARANPTLSVGVHLVLVQGRATAPHHDIPDLVDDDGLFRTNPVTTGFQYFFASRLSPQIEREVRAQLDKFATTGLELSHLDGHLNMHMHPTVLAIVLRLAPAYRLRALRLPREPLALSLRLDSRAALRKIAESATFRTLSGYAARRLATHRIRHPDHLFGLHQSGHLTEAYLHGVLDALPVGTTEIYTHAGFVDDEARRWRPSDYQTAAEVSALTSPSVRAALTRNGIERISYRELANGFLDDRGS